MAWSRDLDILAEQIGTWRREQGFRTPGTILAEEDRDATLGKLMLVVTEISEAAEAVRHTDRDNFIEELADTAIRLLDLSEAMGFSLLFAIHRKMDINAKRPHKHGKDCSL